MGTTNSNSTNYFSPAKWVVSTVAGEGTHTKISDALSSASSGDTIVVMPGTYSDVLTLKAGVNITAYGTDSGWDGGSAVIITGKASFSSAGTVNIYGVSLQTNSDYFLAVTGSAASIVNLNNCYLNCLNNTGITFSSSSSSSQITITNCTLDTGTTGITYFSDSASGVMLIEYSECLNTGASTTACTKSAGQLNIKFCTFKLPINYSSSNTSSTALNCVINTASTNSTFLTTSGTGTYTIGASNVATGSASAISVGTGSVVNINNSIVNSSNTNAITGAGTIDYGGLIFTGTSSTVNTTTQNYFPLTVAQGGTASSTFTAYSVICAGTTSAGAFQNVSGVGTSGQILTSQGAGKLPVWSSTPAAVVSSVTTQTFTSSGTYTPTAGMLYCMVQMCGGGGAGGGATSTGATTGSCGGGGGAGEYAQGVFSASTIGSSQTVTIGAAGTAHSGTTGGNGGNTSLGSLITADGGTGGNSSGAGTVVNCNGGAGGTGGSGGDFRTAGQAGGYGYTNIPATIILFGGYGGSGNFGAGGSVNNTGTSNQGGAGLGYGAGGAGSTNYTSQSALSGGAGVKGVIYITEYVG